MTAGFRRSVLWGLVAAFLAVLTAIVRPDDRALVLEVYLLFVGGLVLVLLVAATARALPPPGRSRLEQMLARPPSTPARPAVLLTLERRVLLATDTAFEVHYRLRPVLREIAAYRLSSRRGLGLDDDGDAARLAVGPEAWELVRPDRPAPPDRLARGVPLADLRAAVDSLERL